MAGKRRRRNWSDEEKCMICAQTKLPGISVSQVARRYDVNANLVFIWLRDPRFQAEAEEQDSGCFLPVEVDTTPVQLLCKPGNAAVSDIPASAGSDGTPLSATRIDISLSDGRRILVEGVTSLPAVLGLVEGLAS